METFKIGETVQLKSGGPRMTVESVEGTNVTCVWFHEQTAKYGTFPAATLNHYTAPTTTVRRATFSKGF